MKLQMVFNPLSCSSIADEYQARHLMSGLLQTMLAGIKAGLESVLRTEQPIHAMELAPNYRVANWCNDPQVDIEYRRFFARLATKCPLLEGLGEEHKDGVMSRECIFEAQSVTEITVVVYCDALLVSLASSEKWQKANLVVQIRCLLDNGDVEEKETTVRHASCPQHIDPHRAWIQEQRQSQIETGSDLWAQRDKLFPCLEFCVEVEEQLAALGKGDLRLKGILDKLSRLDEAARCWTEGAFDATSVLPNVSPESESTMQQYADPRTFTTTEGHSVVFSWHVRLTPNAWRLYFNFEEADTPGKLYIGYIGEHLPTGSDPH